MIEYEFAVYEMPGKLCVASGAASSIEDVRKEGLHYLCQYANDDTEMLLEICLVNREVLEMAKS